MLHKQQLLSAGVGAALVVALGAGALTFAASTPGAAPQHLPDVMGTVSAVAGNIVTLSGKNGTTYTIDASSATITKEETVGVSDIKVGDTLTAQGSVNGTSVTASSIHDGQLPMGGFGRGMGGFGRMGIRGSVSALSGTTLTVTATNPKDNTTSTYTVDASTATVLKSSGTGKPSASTLSQIAVGDTVMVAGQISGTTVTAKTIVDGPFPQWRGRTQASSTSAQ